MNDVRTVYIFYNSENRYRSISDITITNHNKIQLIVSQDIRTWQKQKVWANLD